MSYLLSYSTTLQAFRIELLSEKKPSKYYKEVASFYCMDNLKEFMRDYIRNCAGVVEDANRVLKAKI